MVFYKFSRRLALAATAAVAVATQSATAQTVQLAVNEGTGASYGQATYVGQSFTVEPAGNYSNIRFYWTTQAGADTASGNLYLFTSPYSGLPAGLAATTDNRVGVTTGNGAVYAFQSDVVLRGGTQYFAYSDSYQTRAVGVGFVYRGGIAYTASDVVMNYRSNSAQDAGFEVTGIAAAAPEPATWSLMIVGFGVVGSAMRRRKRASGPARPPMLPAEQTPAFHPRLDG